MFPAVAEYLRDQQLTEDVRLIQFLDMPKLKILRNVWPLRRERFDVSIIPYAMNRLGYNFMSRVIGARERIGFRYQRQRRVNVPELNQRVFDEDPTLHVVEENLRWAAYLTGLDIKAIPDDMLFRTAPESGRAAEEFLTTHRLDQATPLIGIHPSCNALKNQQNRCWPPDHFVQFIERMAVQMPAARFLLFEGPADARLAQMISQNAKSSVVVARMLPVRVVGALIRQCDLFVSNCSGLIHIAAACKVPTVGIYGPTNPTWDKPWKTESIVVTKSLPCSPCFYYSSRPLDCPAKLDYACVRELPVEDVERAALQLLKPVRV
ncbi:MAG: glycosyltransferase family 9 protein [Verrucomicrobiota bacterium]